MKWLNKKYKWWNDFMNSNDRGPGHGVMQGAFYGLFFLSFALSFKNFEIKSFLLAI